MASAAGTMGAVRLYRRGGVWWLDYGEHRGRRLRRSLGTHDEERARAALTRAQLESLEDRAGLRRRLEGLTFSAAVEAWRPWSRISHSPGTRVTYASRLRRLIDAFGAMRIDQLDRAAIERYIADRLDLGVRRASLHVEVQCLSSVLERQVERGQLERNPARGVRVGHDPARRDRTLSQAEVDALCAAAPATLAAMIRVAYDTGLRIGELANLQWSRVDLEAGLIRVEAGSGWQPKSKRGRTVPINARVRRVLLEQQVRSRVWSRYVFPGRDGGPRRKASREFATARERAGLVGDRYARFHDLRHSWATRAVLAGLDLRSLQQIGGWASLVMVQRYSHPPVSAAQAAMERLADLDPGTESAQSRPSATGRDRSRR